MTCPSKGIGLERVRGGGLLTIRQPHHVLLVCECVNDDDWTEYLILHDSMVLRRIGDDSRLDVIPGFILTIASELNRQSILASSSQKVHDTIELQSVGLRTSDCLFV